MNPDTYYRDHWLEIEAERLDTYDSMFEWHPRMAPLLAPAELEPGHSVLDYGCGPGGLSVELARRVGPEGTVHGVDLNAEMIVRARARAERDGVATITRFEQVTDDRLSFSDGSLDRAVCKSVLEYVSDPGTVIAELRRVTRPGGRVHVVDSDWGMLVVEPLTDDTLADLFAAASHAYHTPHIGRRLYRHFRAAGLEDIEVKVLCAPDTTGIRASVIRHMVGYAREGGKMDDSRLDRILSDLEASIEAGTYLMLLPQFLITGTVPAQG